jgi:hypothetical protein
MDQPGSGYHPIRLLPKRKRIVKIRILIAAAWFAGSAQAQTLQLITADEANLPNAPGQIASRGVTRGPGIKFMSPDSATKSIKGPVDLKIAFEPRGGSKIDAASVRMTYLKNPEVDLTERVKSGIKPEGIDVSKAVMPPGNHQIRISVKDDEGRQTNSVLNLTVSN